MLATRARSRNYEFRLSGTRGWLSEPGTSRDRRGAGHQEPGRQAGRGGQGIEGRARIALTVTPVENRLGDLWSLFDFINPGLLGSSNNSPPSSSNSPSARTILRAAARTRASVHPAAHEDRQEIIADLPDKIEVKAFCLLSRKQAALYQQAVDDFSEQLENADGIQRRGIVLAPSCG